MAMLPPLLRPSLAIRRAALHKGLLGPSMVWKVVAVVILGRQALRGVFGRHPDRLGTRIIRPGHVITVAAAAPLTRRQAKRAGISKASLAAQARAELEAAQRAS
jgi:hypothetical protein